MATVLSWRPPQNPAAVMHPLTSVIVLDFGQRRAAANVKPTKVVDATHLIGKGKMREEVWQDSTGKVVRYNLAFIDHQKCPKDNGRILGYDATHGCHHRHWVGMLETIEFPGYEELVRRLCEEVAGLWKKG